MTEKKDIVDRLRAVLHNDRSVELMNREAADEIERLRGMLEVQDEMVKHYVEERDEARREVCNNEAEHLPTMADPHMQAKRRGWDCFKEKP
jgi:hypothetical protein